jgi:large subunit ribosomal protein L25
VLNVVQHELELVCDAASIPNEIHIDLTGLEIGDTIHISQVKLPEGVTPWNDEEDFTVATIVAPSAMKAEEEEVAPEGEVPVVGEEGEEGVEGEGGEAPAEGEAKSEE